MISNKYIEYKKLLLKLRNIDQKMRRSKNIDPNIDVNNVKELKKIVLSMGWPTIQKVGKLASESAWLIAQHADFDIRFQKKVLNILFKELETNPSDPLKEQVAYLTDRICVNEGKKQIYGTQFYIALNGQYLCRPIADNAHLDARRAQMNLGKFSEYEQKLKKFYNR